MVPSHHSLPLSVPSLYFAPLQHFLGEWGWFYEPGHILGDGGIEANSQHICCDFVIMWESSPTGISQACLHWLSCFITGYLVLSALKVSKSEREKGLAVQSSCLGHTEAATLPYTDKAISPTPYWQRQPPLPPHLHNVLELALAWKSGELGSSPSP